MRSLLIIQVGQKQDIDRINEMAILTFNNNSNNYISSHGFRFVID